MNNQKLTDDFITWLNVNAEKIFNRSTANFCGLLMNDFIDALSNIDCYFTFNQYFKPTKSFIKYYTYVKYCRHYISIMNNFITFRSRYITVNIDEAYLELKELTKIKIENITNLDGITSLESEVIIRDWGDEYGYRFESKAVTSAGGYCHKIY